MNCHGLRHGPQGVIAKGELRRLPQHAEVADGLPQHADA